MRQNPSNTRGRGKFGPLSKISWLPSFLLTNWKNMNWINLLVFTIILVILGTIDIYDNDYYSYSRRFLSNLYYILLRMYMKMFTIWYLISDIIEQVPPYDYPYIFVSLETALLPPGPLCLKLNSLHKKIILTDINIQENTLVSRYKNIYQDQVQKEFWTSFENFEINTID